MDLITSCARVPLYRFQITFHKLGFVWFYSLFFVGLTRPNLLSKYAERKKLYTLTQNISMTRAEKGENTARRKATKKKSMRNNKRQIDDIHSRTEFRS